MPLATFGIIGLTIDRSSVEFVGDRNCGWYKFCGRTEFDGFCKTLAAGPIILNGVVIESPLLRYGDAIYVHANFKSNNLRLQKLSSYVYL